MARTIKFRVQDAKVMTRGALMVFGIGIGYEDEGGNFTGLVSIRDCWLKQKNDGSGNYVSFPSKMRVRDGEPVIDDNGYKVYDNFVDLYMEKGANPQKPDTRAPTQAAWAWRAWVIKEATAVYDQLKTEQPAQQQATAAAAPAAAKQRRPAAAQVVVEDNFQDDDDSDDFPF
jgi:hypothetical protein